MRKHHSIVGHLSESSSGRSSSDNKSGMDAESSESTVLADSITEHPLRRDPPPRPSRCCLTILLLLDDSSSLNRFGILLVQKWLGFVFCQFILLDPTLSLLFPDANHF